MSRAKLMLLYRGLKVRFPAIMNKHIIFKYSTISKNVIAYLSNTKIIIVNMYMFLKITPHMKIENDDFVNHIVNNTLFLTLGTPNSSSL